MSAEAADKPGVPLLNTSSYVGSIVSVPVNHTTHHCRVSLDRQQVGRRSFSTVCWHFYCQLVSSAAALGHALGQLSVTKAPSLANC